MIPVMEYTSEADMRAAYAGARQRTRDVKPTVKPSVQQIAAPVRPVRIIRAWSVHQDAHITAWKLADYQAKIKSLEMSLRNREEVISRMIGDDELPAQPRVSAYDVCRATLAECAALGDGNYSMGEILGHRRSREVIKARHKCMAAVVVNCGHLSYPQIGRFFNRDHTTIYHAAKKLGVAR